MYVASNTFVNDAGGNITNNGGSKSLQIDSGNFTQGPAARASGTPSRRWSCAAT
jgi:hypothetical protein